MEIPEKERLIEAHRPHWSSTWIWVGFAAAFFALQGLLFWALLAGWWWLAVPLVLLLAHLMHGHVLAFHEAAHWTLCPNPWCNDGLGVFIGNLSFLPLSLFRAVHHTHHVYLLTPRDEEMWPFVVPTIPRWQRRLAAATELSLGLVFASCLFLRAFVRRGSTIREPAVRRRIWAEYAQMVLMWAAIVTVTACWGGWSFLLGMYVLPALLAGNLQSLRKYIEHMGLTGSTVLSSTRSVVPSDALGRLLAFSMFNISYHGVHHQFARMPQAALPRFTASLVPATPEELPAFPSYRSALWDMLRSLRDPCMGPQWRAPASGTAQRPRVRLSRRSRQQTTA